MTPQAFSYGTISSNKKIYVPPYGLTESLDYMLKIDPACFEISKIKIDKSSKTERWTYGIEVSGNIYFLPYNEDYIMAVDIYNDDVVYYRLNWPENSLDVKGKHISFHEYLGIIYSLPYGEKDIYDYILYFNTVDKSHGFIKLDVENNDFKKWHTSQLIEDKIYAVPRGERWENNFFQHGIEFNCLTHSVNLIDFSKCWEDLNDQPMTNKKFTTLAKSNDKLYAAPYSENPNFDVILKFDGSWSSIRTGIKSDSRKYFSSVAASNGKIYFPPAGHNEHWSELLIIDAKTDNWYIKELVIGKESKKYFSGIENSKGKIYFMPRGGCACMPEDEWKIYGDLAEILVIDTKDDSYYTIDVSEYFVDNTTIEKYNCCVIVDDILFALPYGESETFHTMLIFDTTTEKIIKTIDFNGI